MDEITEKARNEITAGIRIIVAAIPGCGWMAQAWSEYENRVQSERTEEFFQLVRDSFFTLRDQFNGLESYVKASGELPALMERVVLKVQREASQAKRKRFVSLIVNEVLDTPPSGYDDKLSMIECLDTLTDSDLEILSHFALGNPVALQGLVARGIETAGFPGYPTIEDIVGPVVTSISKLEARGLIAQTSPAFGGVAIINGDMNHWVNAAQRKAYVLTPFGKLLVESLKQTGPSGQDYYVLSGS